MKILLKIVILLFSIFSYSQNSILKNDKKVLTIYSTSNKNTSIFFPNPIKSGIVGATNFKFGYNKEGSSKIGMLKSTPGEESNLLVITENGNIYSFIVKHQSTIERLNYFVKDTMAIGNENGEIISNFSNSVNKREIKLSEKMSVSKTANAVTVNDYQSQPDKDTTDIYMSMCVSELKKPIFYNRIYGTKDKVYVRLKNISYIDNNLYFTLILENNSTLDYDLNYLNFYTVSKNKKRNAVSQMIPFTSKYVYNLPSRIPALSKQEVVYVYNKFSINENKTLLIELSEENGERVVQLDIPNTFINNAN